MAATRDDSSFRTEVPGPRSRDVLERLRPASPRRSRSTFPVVAAEARGATVTDVDGNAFIDFAGGVGCLNVGHSHPHVVAAAQEQLERFTPHGLRGRPVRGLRRARRAAARARAFGGPAKAAFFNAGTEAVENAVKFARA